MARTFLRRKLPVATGLALALALVAPAFAATITIVNVDVGTGLGFDDPTPVAPIGGNPGTTLGQQRLIAANFVAGLWGHALDSDVEIFVLATFQPLACTPTTGTLGSAGTTFVFRDFAATDPIFPATWYHSALADKLAGVDLNPGFADISTRYNGAIGVSPTCLTGRTWYYGLDNAAPATAFDFVNVLGHELAHGLGFANFVNEANGTNFNGFTDVYSWFTFDNDQGLSWNVMTDAQRQASGVNDGKVVWTGTNVTLQAPQRLGKRPVLDTSAGNFTNVQAAAFGALLTQAGVAGPVVLVNDGISAPGGGTVTDGCEPFSVPAGSIALIDRGLCGFIVKVKNAQNAGAVGAVIANNVAAGLPGMAGVDPTIVIPSVGISLANGNTLKAALPGVTATLRLDPSLLAGADDAGRVRLFAPNPVQAGSTLSHWDTVATPNLLMEPFINTDLKFTQTLDLTSAQMRDIGWTKSIVIDGCDTGVENLTLADGSTIQERVDECAATATNHGKFVSCVAHLTNSLKKQGILSGSQKGAIQSCAAGADIP